MDTLTSKLEYTVSESKNSAIPVIVVAAGSSSRMGGLDKLFATVGGMPVIARTLLRFERSPYISRIILVSREDGIINMQLICEKYFITKLADIVAGGSTRQESVMCGINRLNTSEDKVLISDGARPFVTERIIEDCVETLNKHDGCLTAIKVNDTVKSVDDSRVRATVDRSKLYLAQTPQGITVSVYKEALKKGDFLFTDDVSVLETVGADISVVEGDYKNIKITTPKDLELAEVFVKEN